MHAFSLQIGTTYMRSNSAPQDVQDAESFYREAVQHNAHNLKAMLGLARIHKQRGELEQCQIQCQKIISADPSDEAAVS
jgi:Tfp pilus assembly protein PilF